MSTKPTITINDQARLIDTLDQKSLDTLSKFGHIFVGPKSGKKHIRVYKQLSNTNVFNNTTAGQANQTN
jgi:hypothetical protein